MSCGTNRGPRRRGESGSLRAMKRTRRDILSTREYSRANAGILSNIPLRDLALLSSFVGEVSCSARRS